MATTLWKQFRILTQASPRLSQRVLHASFWAFTTRIVLRLFATVRTIILARLLAPDDFGLMGIALLMMSLLETFTETGFRQALVQRKGDIRPYLDTAWTVSILRGLVLAGGLFLAAPLAASFFSTPAAALIIRVMAISLLLFGLTNIGIVYFQKELDFHKRFLYQLAQTVAEVGMGITMALLLHSVWALVYGVLAGRAAGLIASYLLHPYRPRPRLDWARAKELYRFGRWVFGSTMMLYLLNHLDDIVVGRVLGVMALGLYQVAYTVSQLTTTELTHVTNQVAFPAYSKLQEQRDRLRKAYLEAVGLISLVAFPMAAGILVLAPDFVGVVLGEQWLPMVPALQVLALWGLIRSLGATTGPLFNAIGRPDLGTKLQLAKLLLMASLIYPLTLMWGLVGAALAVVLNAIAIYPIGVLVATRAVQSPVTSYVRRLLAPGLCSIVMVGVLVSAKTAMMGQPSVVGIGGLIALGLTVYLVSIGILHRYIDNSILNTVRRLLAAG